MTIFPKRTFVNSTGAGNTELDTELFTSHWEGEGCTNGHNELIEKTSNLIGMIMQWPSVTAPDSSKWLKCDGSSISRTTYASLFAVMGIRFSPLTIGGWDGTNYMTFIWGGSIPASWPTISPIRFQILEGGSLSYASEGVTYYIRNGQQTELRIYPTAMDATNSTNQILYVQGANVAVWLADQFPLPDLRGCFIRGYDNGRGVDGGRVFGSYQADANKSHLHPIIDDLFSTSNTIDENTGTPHIATGVQTLGLSSQGSEGRPKNYSIVWYVRCA